MKPTIRNMLIVTSAILAAAVILLFMRESGKILPATTGGNDHSDETKGRVVPQDVVSSAVHDPGKDKLSTAGPGRPASGRTNWRTVVRPEMPSDGIQAGFFFAHGHFISPPYHVEVRGDTVTINGLPIEMLPPRPMRTTILRKDPGDFAWPEGCKGIPSRFENYTVEKYAFLRQERGPSQAFDLLIAAIGKQPGVSKMKVIREIGQITYWTQDGDCRQIGVTPPQGTTSAAQPVPQESAVKSVSGGASANSTSNVGNDLNRLSLAAASYERILRSHGVVILYTPTGAFDGNSAIVTRERGGQDLVCMIIEIAASDAEFSQRLQQLSTLLGDEQDIAREMLENLVITPQLAELRKSRF